MLHFKSAFLCILHYWGLFSRVASIDTQCLSSDVGRLLTKHKHSCIGVVFRQPETRVCPISSLKFLDALHGVKYLLHVLGYRHCGTYAIATYPIICKFNSHGTRQRNEPTLGSRIAICSALGSEARD